MNRQDAKNARPAQVQCREAETCRIAAACTHGTPHAHLPNECSVNTCYDYRDDKGYAAALVFCVVTSNLCGSASLREKKISAIRAIRGNKKP